MTTTNNPSSFSVNAIFAQVLKTDPEQEDIGAHEKMLFERGFNMFGEREISIMVKEYKQMEDMEVLSGVNPDPLTEKHKQKSL